MINWSSIKAEYEKLIADLSDANIDPKQRGQLQKKASQLSSLLALHDEISTYEKEKKEAEESAGQEQGELKEMFELEVEELTAKIADLTKKIDDLLYPGDERDARSVFLEIRAGAGGQEAALFVADLCKMYNNFSLAKGWIFSLVDSSQTDIGGYKELTVHIKGKNVYKFLKFESGVHRVQRVPETETQGRVHTSTVTVAVLPEADEVDIDINPADLRIDVYRASGAGGQHVNTTDSAVRIVHVPTGVVVTCQDERSQLKNKNKAMKVLRARLYEAEKERIDSERSDARKKQIGTGDRSEKIRTYNYPQNRISDHRMNLTLKKLDIVMQGDMSDLLEPLMEWDLQERRKQKSPYIS